MPTSYLAGLIFVLVFAGMILIHEFGHFLAARLLGIEVDEFGVGLPPRAWTFWRLKGYLLTKSGQRIEIPSDFGLPFPWTELTNQQVKFTVNRSEGKLFLRTMEVTETLEEKRPSVKGEVLVDQDGQVVKPQGESVVKTQTVKYGGAPGQEEMVETIRETHPGTEFTLNWLPLGGFVRPKGENDPNIPGGLAAANPWKRLGVLLAGPFMNLLAGVFVLSLLFMQIGIPNEHVIQIYGVEKNSPADAAGIRADDVVLSAGGQAITGSDQLRSVIKAHMDQPLEIVVQRGNEQVTLTATPSSARPASIGALGISMGPKYGSATSWFATIPYSLQATYGQVDFLVTLPGKLISGNIPSDQARFSGVVGMFGIFQQTVSRDVTSREITTSSSSPQPTNFTLELIASLTITIGLFNLFPFPALDGGRIIFLIPEMLFRKRVPPQFENTVHAVGMIILLVFMVYVNVMDVINPLQINLP